MDNINFEMINHTKCLLLYLDMSYLNEVYDASYIKKFPIDMVIKTKCGLTAEAIEYLLSFEKEKTVFDNYYLEKNMIYTNFETKT